MLVVKVLVVQAILILAYYCSRHSFGPISRRMCNLSYVLNTSSLAWCQLTTWVLNDRLLLMHEDNMVESAISYHQLQYFLWCNLATGAINILIKTYL